MLVTSLSVLYALAPFRHRQSSLKMAGEGGIGHLVSVPYSSQSAVVTLVFLVVVNLSLFKYIISNSARIVKTFFLALVIYFFFFEKTRFLLKIGRKSGKNTVKTVVFGGSPTRIRSPLAP